MMNKQMLVKSLMGAIAISLISYFPLQIRAQIMGGSGINIKTDFKPPSRGKPSQTTSGGKRGPCNKLASSLRALVPIAEKYSDPETPSREGFQPTMGYTTQKNPIFWVYVPKLPAHITKAEFKVKDLFDEPIPLALSEESGIFYFRLPEDRLSLELNQPYRWYFSLVCDPDSPANNPRVNGWVQRIEINSDIQRQLADATEKEKIELYAERSIWHETITELAKLHCENPSDPEIADDWTKLLKSSGFELTGNVRQCAKSINIKD